MSAGAAPARATTLGPVTSLAAARAHARALPFADDADDVLGMMADIWPVHVAAGPVHAPALDVDAILVVTGDLIVDGLIADVPSDHGAMLMVLGDLRGRSVAAVSPSWWRWNSTSPYPARARSARRSRKYGRYSSPGKKKPWRGGRPWLSRYGAHSAG